MGQPCFGRMQQTTQLGQFERGARAPDQMRLHQGTQGLEEKFFTAWFAFGEHGSISEQRLCRSRQEYETGTCPAGLNKSRNGCTELSFRLHIGGRIAPAASRWKDRPVRRATENPGRLKLRARRSAAGVRAVHRFFENVACLERKDAAA